MNFCYLDKTIPVQELGENGFRVAHHQKPYCVGELFIVGTFRKRERVVVDYGHPGDDYSPQMFTGALEFKDFLDGHGIPYEERGTPEGYVESARKIIAGREREIDMIRSNIRFVEDLLNNRRMPKIP